MGGCQLMTNNDLESAIINYWKKYDNKIPDRISLYFKPAEKILLEKMVALRNIEQSVLDQDETKNKPISAYRFLKTCFLKHSELILTLKGGNGTDVLTTLLSELKGPTFTSNTHTITIPSTSSSVPSPPSLVPYKSGELQLVPTVSSISETMADELSSQIRDQSDTQALTDNELPKQATSPTTTRSAFADELRAKLVQVQEQSGTSIDVIEADAERIAKLFTNIGPPLTDEFAREKLKQNDAKKLASFEIERRKKFGAN